MQISEATYKNGAFVLDGDSDFKKEGKKFKIIIIEEERARSKKEHFLKFLEKHTFDLPEDYKFDREEIYER